MTTRRSALACAALLWPTCAFAAPDPALLGAGRRALAEGLPQVAVLKLRAFLATQPAAEDRRDATRELARALLGAADAQAAMTLLEGEYPGGAGLDPDTIFWRAQAEAALGKWPEALADDSRAAAQASAEVRAAAQFGQGEALLALGRPADAIAAFKPLLGSPRFAEPARMRCAEIALDSARLPEAADFLLAAVPAPGAGARNPYAAKEHAYLLGRLRLAQGQPVLAEQMFAGSLADPEGLSERLMVVSYWGWAQACLDQGQLGRAQDALELLISRQPGNAYLPQTFAWLEDLYLRDPAPDLSDLRRWADDSTEPGRAARATLTLSRVEAHAGRLERAEELLAGFGSRFPDQPLRALALYDLAKLQLQAGQLPQAHAAAEAARTLASHDLWIELEALEARISLAENDSAGAADRFNAVSKSLDSGDQAAAAAFDAALAWLRAADPGRFLAAQQDFEARFPKSNLNAEFLLEEGLARAGQTTPADRTGRQQAAACLRRFLSEQPHNPRAAEARVALAELAYERTKPNLPAAWREIGAPELREISNPAPAEDPAAGQRDRASYLAIWLADSPGPAHDEEKAISLARDLLEKRPDSPMAPEVRMKLCEIYFRREDYSNAQTQLELLAASAPNSPLAESALYLAGVAASRSMSSAGLDKAIPLLEAAARREGPLKLPARLRQAEVQVRLGKTQDALILYDGVLAATAGRPLSDADLEARCAAFAGRGEALFAQAASDPKLYRDSADAFSQLAQVPGVALHWRRQALTQQGRALENAGDAPAALAAYDDALNASPGADLSSDPEWTWFYRAGTQAARLLESQSQWTAAIAIYKKLAAAEGPLKAEFETLLNRRRLEHFIWEE